MCWSKERGHIFLFPSCKGLEEGFAPPLTSHLPPPTSLLRTEASNLAESLAQNDAGAAVTQTPCACWLVECIIRSSSRALSRSNLSMQ